MLDERAAARSAYAELVAGRRRLAAPFYVRGPMSDWDFATATGRIAEAKAVLENRDAIAAMAARLGVPVPTNLRTAYQTAPRLAR